MKYRDLLTVGTLLMLNAMGMAQISKQGDAYLFRVKHTKGQVLKYKMTVNASGPGQTLLMNTPIVSTVTAVDAKGAGTLQYKVGPVAMTLNGKPLQAGQGQNQVKTTSVKVDNLGNAVGGDLSAAKSAGSVGFPTAAVKIGGSWKAKSVAKTMNVGDMNVDATYKFVGLASTPKGQAAKLSVSMTGTGNAKVKGTGTMLVLLADGTLFSSTNSMQITIGQQTMPMTVSITRQ
jgi:hypothetical protein